jgi:Holliday junction resolvase YEN1
MAFVAGHAQASENPELRTIFFKLVRLLRSPVTPLFVFDGPGRPMKKRGVNVVKRPEWLTVPFQEMLDAFRFQHYTVCSPKLLVMIALSNYGLLTGSRGSRSRTRMAKPSADH